MIGGTFGLSTGVEPAPESDEGPTAYGLLHELGPAAVVASAGDPAVARSADVVVADVGGDVGRAVRGLEEVLRPGALGVIVTRPGSRLRVRRALAATQLVRHAELLPRPDATRPVRLVAVDRDVLAAGLRVAGRSGRLLEALVGGVPGAWAVARLQPTAFVVGHCREAGFGAWLQALVPAADPRRVIVERSRGGGGVVAVWPQHGAGPEAYVKLGAVELEADALERLAPGAAEAGAVVPRIVGRSSGALATSTVAGVRAADLVAAHPERLRETVGLVVSWLERWQHRTASVRAWSAADTERHLWRPLAVLDGLVEPSYRTWLGDRVAAFEGEGTLFAPSHGDLTLANVVLDGGSVGVVDWEEASSESPQLVDLPYLLADVVAARDGYRNRLAAFQAVFARGAGPDAELVAPLLAHAASGAATTAALSVAFHACWLQHAANDVLRDVPGRPFVAIAAAVAADPVRYDPFADAT